jgi:hypothetical protein
MLKFWINYKILIRKLYSKRVRGRSASADSLTFMLLVLQSFTLIFLLEGMFDVKGFVYASLNLNMPIAPVGMGVLLVIYLITRIMFPYKYNRQSIALIRACYRNQTQTTQNTALALLIFSVVLFIVSLIAVLIF